MLDLLVSLSVNDRGKQRKICMATGCLSCSFDSTNAVLADGSEPAAALLLCACGVGRGKVQSAHGDAAQAIRAGESAVLRGQPRCVDTP